MDLHAGRQPTIPVDGVTVKELVNSYLAYQQDKMAAGAIGVRHFGDCRRIVSAWARFVGKSRAVSSISPEEFGRYRARLAKRLGARSLVRQITVIRCMFNYAADVDLIDRPPKLSKVFAPPPARVVRRNQREEELTHGKRLFTPNALRSIVDAAAGSHPATPAFLRPAILLGINGGFGNTDLATLPRPAVDLDAAVATYPRPKTGVERVVPLWPETVTALTNWLAIRPQPRVAEYASLVFLTPEGFPLVRQKVKAAEDGAIDSVSNLDRLSHEFIDLVETLGLRRRGIGFYTLRHTFRTWADEVRDQHAIHRIMGHTIPGMSGIYVEEISLDRLRAVVSHVRAKLFPEAT